MYQDIGYVVLNCPDPKHKNETLQGIFLRPGCNKNGVFC